MHALFSTHPAVGHVHPMIPLASALLRAGHAVTFATSAPFCEYIEGFGFETVPVGLDWLESRANEQFAFMGPPETWNRDSPWPAVFMAASQAASPDLMRLVEERSIDVIVHETTEFAAVIAAEIIGIPAVAIGIGYQGPTVVNDPAVRRAWPLVRESLGLPPDPECAAIYRHLYIDLHPRSLHALPPEWTVPVARPARPEQVPAVAAPPPWHGDVRARSVAYVTLGTVFNRAEGVFERVLDAVTGAGITAVATTGDTLVEPRPRSGAFVERFVPDQYILPLADFVVCHAGYNTVVAALAHGLPMVCIPVGADQHYNAFRVAACGAGIVVDPADAGALEQAIHSVRSDRSYRNNAERLAREIAAMPAIDTMVPEIEALAAAPAMAS